MAISLDTLTHRMRFKNTGAGPVKEAVISIPIGDINTDHTIVTPASGNCIFIVGMFFSESNAVTLKIKYSDDSGGKYKDLELTTNQGVWQPVGLGILPLPEDYPLIIQVSAEVTDMSILYVETKELYL